MRRVGATTVPARLLVAAGFWLVVGALAAAEAARALRPGARVLP